MTVYESIRAEIEALSEHVWAVTDEEDDRVCARLLTLARVGVDVTEAAEKAKCEAEAFTEYAPATDDAFRRIRDLLAAPLAAYEKVAAETGVPHAEDAALIDLLRNNAEAVLALWRAAEEANLICRTCGALRHSHDQRANCPGFRHPVTDALAAFEEARK